MSLEQEISKLNDNIRALTEAVSADTALRREGIEVVREAADKSRGAAASGKSTKDKPAETKKPEDKPAETKKETAQTSGDDGRPTHEEIADLVVQYIDGAGREAEGDAREAEVKKWLAKVGAESVKLIPDNKLKAFKKKMNDLIDAGDLTQPPADEDDDL